MRRTGNRTIKVNKAQLIAKIRENQTNHVKAYEKAVVAYKEEALRQLEALTKKVNDGGLNIRLDLVSPINNKDNYDKIVDMFEWEVDDVVELEQDEFNEYVQDETQFAIQAKMSNSAYLSMSR